jgi:uncharacterized membrane protein
MKTLIKVLALINVVAFVQVVYFVACWHGWSTLVGAFVPFFLSGCLFVAVVLCRARKDIEYWESKFKKND